MIAGLGIPTRFGGELIIDRSDVNSTKASQGSISAKLERIWDHIKDWFYNTNLVEAKQQLFVLHDPQASAAEKADSFFKLKDLVGEGYRDRFETSREALGYKLIINYGDGISPYNQSIAVCKQDYIFEKLDARIDEAFGDPIAAAKFRDDQAKDLPRGTYSIAGDIIDGFRPHQTGDLSNGLLFHGKLERKFQPTEAQHLAIDTMANQNIFILMRHASYVSNGGVFSPEDFHYISSHDDVTLNYDFNAHGADIEMHVNFTSILRSKADMYEGAPERSIFMTDAVLDARILIGPAGNIKQLSATCGIAPL